MNDKERLQGLLDIFKNRCRKRIGEAKNPPETIRDLIDYMSVTINDNIVLEYKKKHDDIFMHLEVEVEHSFNAKVVKYYRQDYILEKLLRLTKISEFRIEELEQRLMEMI